MYSEVNAVIFTRLVVRVLSMIRWRQVIVPDGIVDEENSPDSLSHSVITRLPGLFTIERSVEVFSRPEKITKIGEYESSLDCHSDVIQA
jgi:hypothetical protein